MISILTFVAAGLLVGFISSLFGVGGGIIIVPVLSLLLEFTHQEAVATSLFSIFLVTFYNIYRFQMQKLIHWKTVLLIASFSVFASFLAGSIALYLHEGILILIFILFILYLIVKTWRVTQSTHEALESLLPFKKMQAMQIGSLSGLISGLTGLGGGAVITPFLLAKRVVAEIKVVPVSNGVMFFNALFASLAFAAFEAESWTGKQLGHIHLQAALFIFLGALPASRIGTHAQKYLSLRIRKLVLVTMLIIIGIRLSVKLLDNLP